MHVAVSEAVRIGKELPGQLETMQFRFVQEALHISLDVKLKSQTHL